MFLLDVLSDASISSLAGRGISILTPDQVPGVVPTSSFKTIAVENKLFDVKQVKEASARAAAAIARRPPIATNTVNDVLNTGMASQGSIMSESPAIIGNNVNNMPAGISAFSSSGAISAINTATGGGFPSSNINIDMVFGGRSTDDRSTGANFASIQTDGSFLGLPSGAPKPPSTVSKSVKTKFHDQATLLAMVSEQISKRVSTTPPTISPVRAPTTRRMRNGFPRVRTPFTRPAATWGQQPLPNSMDNFPPMSARPAAAVRVDLPPPPIDPYQLRTTQRAIGVNPTIQPFTQPPVINSNRAGQNIQFDLAQAPAINANRATFNSDSTRNILLNQQPMAGFDTQPMNTLPLDNTVQTNQLPPQRPRTDPLPPTQPPQASNIDFTFTTVPPGIISGAVVPTNAPVDASSFFLDPIPTEPTYTQPITDIGLGFDVSRGPIVDQTATTIIDTSMPTDATFSSVSNTAFVDPIINAQGGSIDRVPSSVPATISTTTSTPVVKPIKSDKKAGTNQIMNISIIDVTNSTVTNDSSIQYDMSPFQNNENWAIFDPSLPVNVNFTDYGPILDIPIDTNQISFTSSSDSGFASVFSQASPQLPPGPTNNTTSGTNASSPAANQKTRNVINASRTIRRTETVRTDIGGPSEVNQRFVRRRTRPVDPIPMNGAVMNNLNGRTVGNSQRPVDLPPPPF